MGYKDILVHVESGRDGEARGRFAIDFAAALEAHLAAIAFTPNAIVPTYGEPAIIVPLPQSYFDDLKKGVQQALDRVAAAASHAGVAVEPRLVEGMAGDLPQLLGVAGRLFDLTIVGQPRTDAVWSNAGELISRLLTNTGRPVLVVPHAGAVFKGVRNVLVAWDGSAEAARAVNDALPLLRAAERALVLVCEPERAVEAPGDLPGADLARHLARHGVNTELRRGHSDELSIGEQILARAASDSADLIVMGGFHHSRLRELLLGGVTKTVLEQTSVPVLLSH